MPRNFLIVVQGGSAVGKTTLANKLSKDLDVYLLAKDHFKEMMYDQLGIPLELDESKIYGRASTSAMYAATKSLLNDGKNVILESVFEKGFAEKDIIEVVADKQVTLLQLYMYASPEIRVVRTDERARSGLRHAGHPDKPGVLTIKDFQNDTHEYRRLGIEGTIDICTDDFTDDDYDKLLHEVKQRLEVE